MSREVRYMALAHAEAMLNRKADKGAITDRRAIEKAMGLLESLVANRDPSTVGDLEMIRQAVDCQMAEDWQRRRSDAVAKDALKYSLTLTIAEMLKAGRW